MWPDPSRVSLSVPLQGRVRKNPGKEDVPFPGFLSNSCPDRILARYQLGSFIFIKIYLFIKYGTDFCKTVETGVDLHVNMTEGSLKIVQLFNFNKHVLTVHPSSSVHMVVIKATPFLKISAVLLQKTAARETSCYLDHLDSRVISILTEPPGLVSFQDTINALSLSCPTMRIWSLFFNVAASKAQKKIKGTINISFSILKPFTDEIFLQEIMRPAETLFIAGQ